MTRTNVGAVLVALLGGMAFAAPAMAQNEQFIPHLVYRTGAYAPNGIPFANGVADYYRLVNERDGGINGVKIVYEECDTGYATDRGVECYERLKGKGPTGAAYFIPLSTGITFALTDKNFPMFFRSRGLRVTRAVLLLRTAEGRSTIGAALAGFSLTLDDMALGPFTLPGATDPSPPFGGLPFSDRLPTGADPRGLEHTLMIDAAGGLAPSSPPPGDVSAIDASRLLDVLLYLEFRLG